MLTLVSWVRYPTLREIGISPCASSGSFWEGSCGILGEEGVGYVFLEGSDREGSSSVSLDAQYGNFWDESWDEDSEGVLGEDTIVKEVRGSSRAILRRFWEEGRR